MTVHSNGEQFSRRQALRLAGGATAATMLAGNPLSSAAQLATPEASPVASPAATPLASSGPITIYPTGANLPTDPVTFRWMVRGLGPIKGLYDQFFPVYQQAHPNITIVYEGLPPAELTQVLPLGIRNGTAPDCFETPDNLSESDMVREGWLRPIDDIMPNFEEWKQSLPPGVLLEGVGMYGGQTYAFPYCSNRNYTTLSLFNADHMQQAGYDPSTEPLTWSTFREAARKITEQGNGQYYGYIMGGGQVGLLADLVSNFAEMAGATGGVLNLTTGEYNYTSDEFIAAIELLLALQSDGSIFPGSLQLNGPEARNMITQGVAGMINQGSWNIPVWQQDNPDFNFGVGSQPVPDAGTPVPIGLGPGSWLPIYVYSGSQNPEIAGDIFSYLASEEGQTVLATSTGGFPMPLSAEIRQRPNVVESLGPRMVKAYELFDQQLRTAPDPTVRNPDVGQVFLEMRALTPNFGETVQGLLTGQLSDVQQAMQDLQDRADAELERGIKAAQGKGAQVSRDDWVFPNYDPTRDYTDEDYSAL
ncbi:MAG: extracellular solute-binding protein [Chloroflexota bacterium]|nr:extracellular solute-binding protein [Chloroflexota bacterium]